MGHFEQADLASGVGAAERAFDVAEEFGFDEFMRNGPAVDRDERFFGAGAGVVDVQGQHFLARAGFAGQEHGGVGPGHGVGQRHDRLHGRARGHGLVLEAFRERGGGLAVAVGLLLFLLQGRSQDGVGHLLAAAAGDDHDHVALFVQYGAADGQDVVAVAGVHDAGHGGFAPRGFERGRGFVDALVQHLLHADVRRAVEGQAKQFLRSRVEQQDAALRVRDEDGVR